MDKDPLIGLAERCYTEGRRFREKDIAIPDPFTGADITNPWYYYDRLYRGFHWDFVKKMASWVSQPYKNIIFMGVETYTTLLTDSKPSFSVIPREEGDSELSEVVKAAVEYWWDSEHMDAKTALAVKASRIYGIGWLHTYYDSEKKRACARVIHPDNVWVDPDCTVEDFDPTYVLYQYRAQVGDVWRTYPKSREGFDPKWRLGMDPNSPIYSRLYDNTNPAVSCEVYELWYADPEKIVWDEELGDSVVTKSKKKYPGGRKVVMAGGKVLSDEANPYDHGEIPFTPIHAYPVPGQFYGIGDVQNLLNMQVMRNRMSQFLFDQMLKAGGGYVLVGQGSGIDPAKVTNAPIQILPCRDVNQFRIERAPQPSRAAFDYISLLDYDTQDVLGSHDISQGRRPAGNPATAQEIAVLTESDRTRVRMASRWLTWALMRVGKQVVSMWAQFPDFQMMLRLAGQEVPMDNEEGSERQPDRVVEFSGKSLISPLTKEAVELDLIIADTSTLPQSQQEQTNRIRMLLELGVITPEDILKYKLLDIPHADAILADRQEAMQEQAQAPAAPEVQPPDMQPPPDASPEMTGAMQGRMPQGMDMETLMQAAQMTSEQMGVPPEELLASIGL